MYSLSPAPEPLRSFDYTSGQWCLHGVGCAASTTDDPLSGLAGASWEVVAVTDFNGQYQASSSSSGQGCHLLAQGAAREYSMKETQKPGRSQVNKQLRMWVEWRKSGYQQRMGRGLRVEFMIPGTCKGFRNSGLELSGWRVPGTVCAL